MTEDRSLVEAWGHRPATGALCVHADPESASIDGTHTVVPLIAADRLSEVDTAIAVVEAMHERCDWKPEGCGCASNVQVQAVLAALRAHLEGSL